jgi:hypothetical protein
VVGALPKYLNSAGHIAKVVMPMYRTKFLYNHKWDVVHKGYTNLGNRWFEFTVIKEAPMNLGLIFTWLISTGSWTGKKCMGTMMMMSASQLSRLQCSTGLLPGIICLMLFMYMIIILVLFHSC